MSLFPIRTLLTIISSASSSSSDKADPKGLNEWVTFPVTFSDKISIFMSIKLCSISTDRFGVELFATKTPLKHNTKILKNNFFNRLAFLSLIKK